MRELTYDEVEIVGGGEIIAFPFPIYCPYPLPSGPCQDLIPVPLVPEKL